MEFTLEKCHEDTLKIIEQIEIKNSKKAEKHCEKMMEILTGFRGMQIYEPGTNNYSRWFEVLVIASFMFYSTYDIKHKISSLFYAREKYQKIFRDSTQSEYVFKAIESALGFYGPVSLKAPVDTPTETFALALWMVNPKSKMYER